ncbi:hypothetical protein QJS10_CPA06g00859 [Acorus calamus]|uniref:Uncharacterized protein n=1 Tax=Acorus calamus TaxID=4465 RepID=A0AAV9EN66_ACOCL|nr:hypothetical protein QJS10_CPA06g00859 [Acorus calamus]
MTTACFPAELIQGTKSVQPGRKKLRWDTDSEKKLEQLEKREEKSQAIGEKDKEEKDDENKEKKKTWKEKRKRKVRMMAIITRTLILMTMRTI